MWHRAAGAMCAVHQTVELVGGSGVIGQESVGLPLATALTAAGNAAWVALAPSRPRTGAFLAGVSVAVPVAHLRLWPWTASWGVPRLTAAEGLPASAMPLYNGILYGWAAAGVGALVAETPPRHRPWALAGAAAVFALAVPAVRRHLAYVEREAQRRPRWWNRAWV